MGYALRGMTRSQLLGSALTPLCVRVGPHRTIEVGGAVKQDFVGWGACLKGITRSAKRIGAASAVTPLVASRASSVQSSIAQRSLTQ